MKAILFRRGEGRKYEKAKEWGVQVVNSTFIADIIHSKWSVHGSSVVGY